jgi:hypothetical protein
MSIPDALLDLVSSITFFLGIILALTTVLLGVSILVDDWRNN